jgi:uncharacterized protein YggT (Ycf19 family)
MYPQHNVQRTPPRPVASGGQLDKVNAETARTFSEIEAGHQRLLLKISQVIWLSFGALEGLIGLRILLKLMVANPQAPFAQFVYGVTQPFLFPFIGLTSTPAANGVVLEISSIIALFAYALLSLLIERLIRIIFSRPQA